jgi:DNA-binding NtrC family response regulator
VKEQLQSLVQQMRQLGISYEAASREFKKQYILSVLAGHRGNQSRAARQLNMHRNTLSRILTELEIDPRQVRTAARRPPRSVENTPVAERRTVNH